MSNEIKKPESSKKASEDLREKLMLAIVGFVLTGILGAAITTWIQQRGWNWQNRVLGIEKDVDNVFSAYKSASELLNGSWHAAYHITHALEREETGPTLASARSDYDNADRDWALHYANTARDVEFYVDGPFGIDASADLNKVWSYVCQSGAHRAGVDSQSVRVLLETINHCQQQLKNELELMIDPAPDTRHLDQKERQPLVADIYRRLDQLYQTNDFLRCVMFERAMVIREALTEESYWSAFFGIDKPTYVLSRKLEDCDKGSIRATIK